MALHHQPGRAARSQPGQPGQEKIVQGLLPNADGWIGPDTPEGDVRRDVGGPYRTDVVQAQIGGALADQSEGPVIDVDRPHGAPRGPGGQCAGLWAP